MEILVTTLPTLVSVGLTQVSLKLDGHVQNMLNDQT